MERLISNGSSSSALHRHQDRNGNNRRGKEKHEGDKKGHVHVVQDKKENRVEDNSYSDVPALILITVLILRVVSLLVWTGGIVYATYQLFKYQEREFPLSRDPELNPGILSPWIGRGKDISDMEWRVFPSIIWTKLISICIMYQVAKAACRWKKLGGWVIRWMSPVLSVFFLLNLIGSGAVIHILTVSSIYWIAMKLRRKWVIWVLTVVLIFHITSPVVGVMFPRSDNGEMSLYLFVIISAWNFSRCVSFCMDVWDRSDEEVFSIRSYIRLLQYCLYLPCVLTGPLVMYDHFEEQVLENRNPSPKKGDLKVLVKGLVKLAFVSLLLELIFSFLYFKGMSWEGSHTIYRMNIWAVCATVYWLGQTFALKYKVFYGVASYLAEFDGLSMYPPPCCPSYIHRYSVLWKDFDRGLYIFLVRYIYAPGIRKLSTIEWTSEFPLEFKKLCASALTFMYVFLWHNISFDVFMWAAFNFGGITLERIGSLVKKQTDRIQTLHPLFWDFLVEPLFTVPLAAMSILNSTVFCASLASAEAFYIKLYYTFIPRYSYHLWICLFLYAFTHVGVAVRTWKPFKFALKASIRPIYLNILNRNTQHEQKIKCS